MAGWEEMDSDEKGKGRREMKVSQVIRTNSENPLWLPTFMGRYVVMIQACVTIAVYNGPEAAATPQLSPIRATD